MPRFQFDDRIPPSKSLLNRWLCIATYAQNGGMEIRGDSSCDDVRLMRKAIASLRAGREIDCGAAGTVLRFMTLRASRVPGKHILRGTTRLMRRPQGTLIDILAHFGVRAEQRADALTIDSAGWQAPASALEIDRSASSQFASSLVLNAWDLDFDLSFTGSADSVSDSYFDMSLSVAREAGMMISEGPASAVAIPRGQSVSARLAVPEPDMSSAFAVAALGSVAGKARLREFPKRSLQPDHVFPSILRAMGAGVEADGDALVFSKGTLKGVEWNLRDCPDLFPVLSVLCALSEGPSRLFGASHLIHKESDRISHAARLVQSMGRECVARPDGLEISAAAAKLPVPFDFDPADDHRFVMAASVAKWAGIPVKILHPECVTKSYPEFIAVAGL